MLFIKVNNIKFLVKSSLTLLEACQYVGIYIPRFCFHENLSIAGNCRMCLVEVEKAPKPVASCALPVTNNLIVFTDSPLVKKARENIIETILLNHPLDCPICDQGGECDLQDQTKIFSGIYSRFYFSKRVVEDKPYGNFIKTIMTRCIHCTRCVRFSDEIGGTSSFGTFNRGSNTEIGSYTQNVFDSEVSGNVIDLCPVGALTSKVYAFKTRPWELRCHETIDCTDGLGTSIIVNTKESDILRVQPKVSNSSIFSLITDKTRFSFDSLKRNRITKAYTKSKNKLFLPDAFIVERPKKPSFYSFCRSFFEQNKGLRKKREILCLIDNLDLKILSLLKKVSQYFGIFKIATMGGIFNNKIFNFSTYNSIYDLNNTKTTVCILLAINLKLESSLINTKLRLKYYEKEIELINIGSIYKNTYAITFINISPLNLINILEGKNKYFKDINKQNILLIVGNAFERRFFDMDLFLNWFRKINPTSIIIKNELKIQDRGLQYFNIYALNSKLKQKTKHVFCFNLDDVIKIRKILIKKQFSWFNSHGSELSLLAQHIIPVRLFLEDNLFFFNLENKIKKTYKVIKNSIPSYSEIFNSFFKIQLLAWGQPYSYEPKEKCYGCDLKGGCTCCSDGRGICKGCHCIYKCGNCKNCKCTREAKQCSYHYKDLYFNTLVTRKIFSAEINSHFAFENFVVLKKFSNLKYNNKEIEKSLVNKQIFKPLLSDFYIDSTYTKNSLFLIKRSQELKKLHRNFH